jgi:hypothetical protein
MAKTKAKTKDPRYCAGLFLGVWWNDWAAIFIAELSDSFGAASRHRRICA